MYVHVYPSNIIILQQHNNNYLEHFSTFFQYKMLAEFSRIVSKDVEAVFAERWPEFENKLQVIIRKRQNMRLQALQELSDSLSPGKLIMSHFLFCICS